MAAKRSKVAPVVSAAAAPLPTTLGSKKIFYVIRRGTKKKTRHLIDPTNKGDDGLKKGDIIELECREGDNQWHEVSQVRSCQPSPIASSVAQTESKSPVHPSTAMAKTRKAAVSKSTEKAESPSQPQAKPVYYRGQIVGYIPVPPAKPLGGKRK